MLPVIRGMNRGGASIVSLFIAIIFLSTLEISCQRHNDYVRNSTHTGISLESIKNGEVLAQRYCQSCHLLPSPALVDTKSWETGVLPQMGPRLGILEFGLQNYPSLVHDRLLDSNFYPAHPLLELDEWQDIVNYFVATSPDSLPAQKRDHPIKMDLSLFTAQLPPGDYQNAATTYLKIIRTDTLSRLIVSDAVKQNIYVLNNKIQVTDSLNIKGAIVDIDFLKEGMLACNIGMLNPNNGRFGKVQLYSFDANNNIHPDAGNVLDSLKRPVQLTTADLNKDGQRDIVVCEFGYLTGSLSWMENKGHNLYTRHVLRALPGAIKAYIDDYNHDGLPDIWALFAQGEEGIFLFTNKGNGKFEAEEVLRFPPAYGSSYFELTDFNKDGYPDIMYTCGDNADFAPVFKPYHGVYIFLNDKTNHFMQKYFFAMNGCYKALARDFDNDGDLDIAAISFFADYENQPEEGFVYLKNAGDFDYFPSTIREGQLGRWLVMDAGDIDGDGRLDIVLGNFSTRPAMNKSTIDWKKSPPFIILKNIGR